MIQTHSSDPNQIPGRCGRKRGCFQIFTIFYVMELWIKNFPIPASGWVWRNKRCQLEKGNISWLQKCCFEYEIGIFRQGRRNFPNCKIITECWLEFISYNPGPWLLTGDGENILIFMLRLLSWCDWTSAVLINFIDGAWLNISNNNLIYIN